MPARGSRHVAVQRVVATRNRDDAAGRASSNAVLSQIDQLDQKLAREDEQKPTITVESLLSTVQEERHRLHVCLHFPFMLLYFASFACCVLSHENLKDTGQMDRKLHSLVSAAGFDGHELRGGGVIMTHKDFFEDVTSPGDFWQFLEEGMLGRLLQPLSSLNGTVSNGEVHRAERVSRLLGGLQLQQQRRESQACAAAYPSLGPIDRYTGLNPLLSGVACYLWDAYSSDCFGAGEGVEGFCPDKVGGADGTAGRRLFEESHVSGIRGRTFEEGRFTVSLHSHEGLERARAKLARLREQRWIDDATQWAALKAVLLNPDLKIFSQVVLHAYFAPSGQTITRLAISSFPAGPYLEKSTLAADIVFAVCWLHVLVRCWAGLLYAVVYREKRKYATRFWTYVEWATMLGGLAIMGAWFYFLGHLTALRGHAMDLALQQPRQSEGLRFATAAQQEKYLAASAALHAETDALAAYLEAYRIFICWYTLFIIARFFEAFEAQPKLAVVTHTFAQSAGDMGHFLVVLMSMFCSFAVAGMLLFGQRLVEFCELRIALHQCFLVMLGDFDYAKLAGEHPISGAIWMFAFACGISILLLNMALAIILDVYLDVHTSAFGAVTIWRQAGQLLEALWHKHDWWSLRRLDLELSGLSCKTVTRESFMEQFPGMPLAQVLSLLDAAEQEAEEQQMSGFRLSDATNYMSNIFEEVEELDVKVDTLIGVASEERQALEEFLTDYPLDPETGEAGGVRYVGFDEDSEHRLHVVEKRLLRMEEELSETMRGAVSGSKEMRHLVTLVEDMAKLKFQRPPR